MRAGAWLLATLLVPGALAAAFDPLALPWVVRLAADGSLQEDAPAEGGVAFPPSDPATPALPLAFSATVPVTSTLGAAQVHLVVVADRPLVARNGEGHSLEVALLVDGRPVATARHAHPLPLLAPGDRMTLALDLPTGEALAAEGAPLALHVTALMPAVPQDGLRLLVGKDATLAFPALRASDARALRMQDGPLEDALATAAFPGARDVRVHHDRVEADALEGARFLAFRGVEEGGAEAAAAHAHANRSRRVEAAHAFTVGSALVRVHPGLAVVVPVAEGMRVACVKNCPSGGFEATVRAAAGNGTAGTTPATPGGDGVLIPPPRATPTPAQEKEAPWGLVALAALVLAVGLTSRRR